MSPGTPLPVARPAISAGRMIRSYGASTFAEDPRRDAIRARVIWDATLDPGTVEVRALPTDRSDSFDPRRFKKMLTLAVDPSGREHAVLSDGYQHVRIDVTEGTLASGNRVFLQYSMVDVIDSTTERRLMPLRRLAALCRTGRFLPALFPRDLRLDRHIDLLRVHDALVAGASQRDIALRLFGNERVPKDWRVASDSLRSRVRRLIRDARRMAGGGHRLLVGRTDAE
jgi:hypothetical protein